MSEISKSQTPIEATKEGGAGTEIAKKLAADTRAQGIGYATGVFPKETDEAYRTLGEFGGGNRNMGSLLRLWAWGREIPERPQSQAEQKQIKQVIEIEGRIRKAEGYEGVIPKTRLLVLGQFPLYYSETEEVRKTGRLPWQKEKYTVKHYLNYDGRVKEDWIQLEYYGQSGHDKIEYRSKRNKLMVLVPPNIGAEILQHLEEDPDFIDKYFKAVFSNVFGEEPSSDVTFMPAEELFVFDMRKLPEIFDLKKRRFSKTILC